METTVLSIPRLWADHHVLRVRETLIALNGVEGVYASAAWKHVVIRHDSDTLDESDIIEALASAGYQVGATPELDGLSLGESDRAWKELGVRVTRTNERDKELSGDFRRY